MPLFRREKLHERLARTGGLDAQAGAAEPVEAGRPWELPVAHGAGARPRRWDLLATAEAPALTGDERTFTALPDGTLLVDEDVPDGATDPLAQAVESRIKPPYRAEAVRRDGDTWAVGARRIEVVQLPNREGEELTLTVTDEEKRLVVDGVQEFGSVPQLERVAGSRYRTYSAHATRLDDDVWELRLTPL
jgi:hypothetical protein